MSDQPEALRVATKLDEDFSLDHVTTSVPYAARLLREQHAEIERLRADAERYRYLRNRDPDEVFNKSGKAAGVWIDWEDDTAGLQLLTGDDADAAIDAATAEERKP